ncbi:hypothetical protein CDAR_254821, partial [Caerostris darwini]
CIGTDFTERGRKVGKVWPPGWPNGYGMRILSGKLVVLLDESVYKSGYRLSELACIGTDFTERGRKVEKDWSPGWPNGYGMRFLSGKLVVHLDESVYKSGYRLSELAYIGTHFIEADRKVEKQLCVQDGRMVMASDSRGLLVSRAHFGLDRQSRCIQLSEACIVTHFTEGDRKVKTGSYIDTHFIEGDRKVENVWVSRMAQWSWHQILESCWSQAITLVWIGKTGGK